MLEITITRWFVNDDPAIHPIEEVSTWWQHCTMGDPIFEDGVEVPTIIPIDARARHLGALRPPEVPVAEDWWLFVMVVGADAADVEPIVGPANEPFYPDFASEYWTWITIPPKEGWTSTDQAGYDAALLAWEAAQQAIIDNSDILVAAATAAALEFAQDAWDEKHAALIGDGISPTTAVLLLGPRPGGI